jgi:hypothetical protein
MDGEKRFYLRITARSSTLPQYIWWSAEDGLVFVGSLLIQPTEDDYANKAHSAPVSNCSSGTIEQITHGLGECITMYTKCFDVQAVAATRDVLPTRLLDLGFVAHEGRVRLKMSRSLSQHSIYASLSHCWGGGCGMASIV